MEITNFFTTQKDPFESQKIRNLTSAMDTISQVCTAEHEVKETEQEFMSFLHGSLWGNRSDLSLNPTGVNKNDIHHTGVHSSILIDDSNAVYSYFKDRKQGGNVVFIMDNAGFELVCDLFLADMLIRRNMASSVTFHFKAHPTFVSDALIKDFYLTLDILDTHNSNIKEFSSRWREYVRVGTWKLDFDYYWNSPQPFWEGMPIRIQEQISNAILTVIKGDANYRRLHGDLHWKYTESTKTIVNYFPGSLLILRTLKAEVQSGLTREILNWVNKETNWLTSGKYGVIQLILK